MHDGVGALDVGKTEHVTNLVEEDENEGHVGGVVEVGGERLFIIDVDRHGSRCDVRAVRVRKLAPGSVKRSRTGRTGS